MGWRINDLPVIGKELAKVGKIYDIASLPCSPSPEIWTLAFFYGIPRMLWALYKPDPLDTTWERVGRTRGIKRRQTFKFEEEYTQDIDLKPGLRWVRWAGDWAQRVGWWFLIVDAAINHAMYWQSAAYAFEGCKTPGNPYAQGTGSLGFDITANEWHHFPAPITEEKVFVGGVGACLIPAGYGYYSGAEINSIPHPDFPPEQQAVVRGWRLINVGDGSVLAQGEADVAQDGQSSKGAGFAKKPILSLTDKLTRWEYTCGGPGATRITSCSCTWTGAGIPNGLGQGDP